MKPETFAMILLLITATVVAAPELPHLFYGSAAADGSDLPTGSVIIAKVGGVEKGRITTTAAGKYGGPAASDDKLLVQGDIDDGATIEFYTWRLKANEVAQFDSGKIENKNLTWGYPSLFEINESVFNESMLCVPNSTIKIRIAANSSSAAASGGGGGGGAAVSDFTLELTCASARVGTVNNVSRMGSAPSAPEGLTRVSNAFEISFSDFDGKATITGYNEGGIDEAGITPFKYDGGSWNALDNDDVVSRDTAANKVSFKVSPGSPYALFGGPSISETPDEVENTTVIVNPDNPVELNVSGMLVNITSSDNEVAVINNLSVLGGSFLAGTTTPSGVNNISNAFEISVSGNVSITVTISYNDTGIDESSIKIYKFVNGTWTAIPSSDIIKIDTAANTITFKVQPGGTPYTAFASPPSAGGGTTTPPTGGAGPTGGTALSLSIDAPTFISIQAGASGSFDIIVRANNDPAPSTTPTVSGLPVGFTSSVNPASAAISENSTRTFTITIFVPLNESPRTFTFTVRAQSGTVSATRNVDLIIPQPGAPIAPAPAPTPAPPGPAPAPAPGPVAPITGAITAFVTNNPTGAAVLGSAIIILAYAGWRMWKKRGR